MCITRLDVLCSARACIYRLSSLGLSKIRKLWLLLVLALFSCPFSTLAQDGRAVHHVFPQFVDGRFPDGTYYRSALMWTNVDPTATSNVCVFVVQGVNTSVQSARFGSTLTTRAPITFNPAIAGSDIFMTSGMGTIQMGYADLFCAEPVSAQIVYSFCAANGAKLSEASALSIPASKQLELLVDQRGGAHVGIALANDNDNSATVGLTIVNAQDTVLGQSQIQIQSGGQIAKFLDELVTNVPAEFVGRLFINSTIPLGATGLRFSGVSFTTIDPFVRP
jgi:hypothetical protein